MFQRFANDWLDQINAPMGPSRRGRNKLRTYCQFKNSYSVENYCAIILPPTCSHRSAFSKFRCGVAPIRIETGRFKGLPEERRLCPFCNVIEDESHVLLDCHLCNDLRTVLYETAISFLPDFAKYDGPDKLRVIFSRF